MSSAGAATASEPMGLGRFCGTVFTGLLAYYTVARFFGVDYEGATQLLPPQVLYVLFALPVVAIGGFFSIAALVNGRIRLPESLLLIYFGLVLAVSLMRADFAIIPSVIAFVLPIFGIWSLRLAPSPNLLNTLLYIAIPLGAIAFLIGLNSWALIPGFANDKIKWRASIFPGVSDTAYFCAVIIMANIWFQNGVLRRLSLLLASYFLLFTVIRSALIGVMMAVAYRYMADMPLFCTTFRRWLLITVMVAAFIAVVVLPAVLALVLPTGQDNAWLNQLLFHTEEGVQDEQGLSETVYRGWLWAQHLTIFLQNPLIGIGSYELKDYVDTGILGPNNEYTGTESFITGQLSRVGLIAGFLYAAILLKMHEAMKAGEHAAVACGIVIIVLLFSHGGVANTYNVQFLLLVASLNWRTGTFQRLAGGRRSSGA